MSKLDELIKEFCPNGVEYVSIGSVVDYEQPSKYIVNNTDYNDDFSTPVLTAGQSFILGYTNETHNLYNASKENPVIIFDDFTAAFKWVDFPFKVKSSAMKILTANKEKTTLRYIFHVMGSIGYSSDEHKRLWISIYSEIKIPLPPLPVQEEIVRILDNFTELTARKKQYEYYRDSLLTFGDEVPRVTLGEVCVRTNNIRWQDTNDEYYYIDLTSVDRETNEIRPEKIINAENAHSRAQQIVKTDDVLFATTRPTLQRYCSVPQKYDGHICSTGFCVLRANKDIILPKFLYYSITTGGFNLYVESNQEGTSYPAISDTKVKKYEFCLPPLFEQQRIVDILDRFDVLCNDLTIGLPAEIEARKKQYEYYRNKLLTFKEVDA